MHNDATLPLFSCGRDDTGLSLQVFHISTNDIKNHFLTEWRWSLLFLNPSTFGLRLRSVFLCLLSFNQGSQEFGMSCSYLCFFCGHFGCISCITGISSSQLCYVPLTEGLQTCSTTTFYDADYEWLRANRGITERFMAAVITYTADARLNTAIIMVVMMNVARRRWWWWRVDFLLYTGLMNFTAQHLQRTEWHPKKKCRHANLSTWRHILSKAHWLYHPVS